MKGILVYIILIAVSISLYAQDVNLVNQSIKFVGTIFVITESNPLEKPESDLINNIFHTSLKEYSNKSSDSSNTQKILGIFNILYQNGDAFYSDSDEERRMKLRRAACFASIALLSDADRGFTFIQYAKFALIENNNKPNIEFIEDQYLGLLFIEIVFKYEDNQLNNDDLRAVREFINLHQTNMNAEIVAKAISLLDKFKKKI